MFSLEHFSDLEITQTQVGKTYPNSKQMKIGKQIEMKEEGAWTSVLGRRRGTLGSPCLLAEMRMRTASYRRSCLVDADGPSAVAVAASPSGAARNPRQGWPPLLPMERKKRWMKRSMPAGSIKQGRHISVRHRLSVLVRRATLGKAGRRRRRWRGRGDEWSGDGAQL